MKEKTKSFWNYVFYAILSAIIFMIVYSIWMNPSVVGEFFDGAKESTSSFFLSGIQKTEETNLSIPSYVQKTEKVDSSLASCLSEIERKVEIMKQKFPGKVKSNIQESNKFNNKQSALDYLEEWDFLALQDIAFPEFFGMNQNKEYDDIIISLIKIEASYGGEVGGGLIPLICIDGSLTEASKRKLKILY